MSSCACDWPSSLTVSRRALRRRLSDLLAVFDRLLRGLLRGVLHLVGHLADPLVLHPGRGGTKRPAMNPTAAPPMASPIGLLSAIDLRPAGALLELGPVGRLVRHGRGRAAHAPVTASLAPLTLPDDRILLVADPPLHATGDVGLVAEGVDGVTHLLPRLLNSLLYAPVAFQPFDVLLDALSGLLGNGCSDFLDLLAPLKGQHACDGAPR